MTMQPDLDYLATTQLYRPGRRAPAADRHEGWAPPIAALRAAGYSFLPVAYHDDGCLFRGLQTGLRQFLAGGCGGWFDGDDEMCRVERAMGVYFLTSEPADAVSVSRLPAQPADGGILVLRASAFNAALTRGEAAVLAVGDGGLVFRYPLLAAAPAAADVALVLVPAACDTAALPPSWRARTAVLAGNSRRELEHSLQAALAEHGLAAAAPVRVTQRPGGAPKQEHDGR